MKMSGTSTPPADSAGLDTSRTRGDRVGAFIQSFASPLPRRLACCMAILVFPLDGCAYFGILVRLGPFLAKDVQVADKWATWYTGFFSMAVTLFMFGFGSYSERFGVRRSLIGAFSILTVGR